MSLSKNIISTFITNLSNVFISFISSIFLNRVLGVQGKGEFTIFLTSLGLLSTFFNFGIDLSLKYYVAKKEITPSQAIIISIFFSIIIGFFLFIFVFFKGNFIFYCQNFDGTYSLFVSFLIVISILTSNISSILHGLQKFIYLNNFLILHSFITLTSYLILFFLKKNNYSIDSNVVIVIHSFLIIFNFFGIVFYYFKNNNFNYSNVNKRLLIAIFSLGGLAFLGNFIQFLNYRVDVWIVESYLGVSKLGLYALAANLAQLLLIVPKSISHVIMPYLISKKDNSNRNIFILGKIVLFICLFISFFVSCLSENIILILYGEEFMDSSKALNILVFGISIFSICMIYGSALQSENYQNVNVLASALGLLTLIICDFYLLKENDIVGVALGASCSYAMTTIVVIVFFKLKFSCSFKDIFIPNKDEIKEFFIILNRNITNYKEK